jgi:hypothetical protein
MLDSNSIRLISTIIHEAKWLFTLTHFRSHKSPFRCRTMGEKVLISTAIYFDLSNFIWKFVWRWKSNEVFQQKVLMAFLKVCISSYHKFHLLPSREAKTFPSYHEFHKFLMCITFSACMCIGWHPELELNKCQFRSYMKRVLEYKKFAFMWMYMVIRIKISERKNGSYKWQKQ